MAVTRPQFCYMSSVDGALTIMNSRLHVRTRFLSGPLAHLEPSTNSVLLSLC